MNKKQLAQIRHDLGRTQSQLAVLLGTSLKAVQSFEQGWRDIPIYTERQILLLLALKYRTRRKVQPCWVQKECPDKTRRTCPAWEFKAGHFCWLINGTLCQGKVQSSWAKKMKLCRGCDVFRPLLAAYSAPSGRSGSGAQGDKMDRE